MPLTPILILLLFPVFIPFGTQAGPPSAAHLHLCSLSQSLPGGGGGGFPSPPSLPPPPLLPSSLHPQGDGLAFILVAWNTQPPAPHSSTSSSTFPCHTACICPQGWRLWPQTVSSLFHAHLERITDILCKELPFTEASMCSFWAVKDKCTPVIYWPGKEGCGSPRSQRVGWDWAPRVAGPSHD